MIRVKKRIFSGCVCEQLVYLAAGVLQSLDGMTFYLDLVNNILKARFTELIIAGKAVSWQENEDGTFTLIGR